MTHGWPTPRKSLRAHNEQPEHAMQCAVFEWARYAAGMHPELHLLEGSMNGVKLTTAQAGKAKAAGMLRGAHDIRLPVARGGFIGWCGELKCGKNKPTPEQILYGERMMTAGHQVGYFYDDWTKVRDSILAYLAL